MIRHIEMIGGATIRRFMGLLPRVKRPLLPDPLHADVGVTPLPTKPFASPRCPIAGLIHAV
jgi:hypothetical protein